MAVVDTEVFDGGSAPQQVGELRQGLSGPSRSITEFGLARDASSAAGGMQFAGSIALRITAGRHGPIMASRILYHFTYPSKLLI
jgi:hypothetical protein